MPETADFTTNTRGAKVSGSDVKDDMTSLRGDVEKLIEDVANLARQRVSDGIDSGAKLKETVNENITELAERARDYVRDNPLGACATAAAAGFAIALLMKR
jgi:ElaB/YqjD/DUF883 family membrane-anchored ribosome-binding protein